jgi:translocation and assembly module TamA
MPPGDFNASIEWLLDSGPSAWTVLHPVLRLRLLLFLAIAALGSAHAAERPLARFALTAEPPAEVVALLDRALRETAEADSIDREDEERMLRRLRGDALDVLATEGYFSPTLAIGTDDSGEARYVIRLELGRRTHVTEVVIEFAGELADRSEAVERLRADWALPVGEPFRDERWSAAKTRLLNRIRGRDFAAARIGDAVALVNEAQATAQLRVEIDSGPAYTVGAVEIRGLKRYDAQLVERYNPFTVGEPYDADKLLEFQRRLQRTPYFSAVIVDVDPGRADGRNLPVLIEVREAQTKRVSFSLGYSTDTGVRGEVAYRQATLFDNPYSLQSGISLDRTRQAAYADVYLPPKPGDQQDAVGTLIELTDIEGVKTNRWAVGAQRTHKREFGPKSIDTQLALNFQHESREVSGAPEEDTTNDVVSATYAWTRRDVDSITQPTRGSLVTLSGTVGLGRSSVTNFLNTVFVRGYGRYVYYLPLSPRDQVILRTEAGYVAVDDPRVVPNECLFRTGGVGTVRGYAFQSLGRKVGTSTTGSTTLAVLSAEYIRWLRGDWGAAIFVDAGNAADGLSDLRLARGYGLGARYRTLAGPIAVDVAWADQTHGVRVHFSVAIAF